MTDFNSALAKPYQSGKFTFYEIPISGPRLSEARPAYSLGYTHPPRAPAYRRQVTSPPAGRIMPYRDPL